MKIKDHYTKEQIENLHKRVDEFLEGDAGFIIISDNSQGRTRPRVTDLYNRVCAECALKQISFMVADAQKIGLLAKPQEHH